MTHDRRRSTAAGNSWRKWEPNSWDVAYRRRVKRQRFVDEYVLPTAEVFLVTSIVIVLLIAAYLVW